MSAELNKDPLYIVLHIPKTAGTTLVSHLRRHLGEGEFFEASRESLSLSTGLQGPEVLRAAAQIIATLDPESKSKIRVIMGHLVSYGLHHTFERPVRYVAFFRHPVSRVASHYDYLRARWARGETFAPSWLSAEGDVLSFDRALESEPALRNLVTRYLQARGFMMGGHTANAIEKFWFCGLVEQFDKDSEALLAEMDLPPCSKNFNVSSDDLASFGLLPLPMDDERRLAILAQNWSEWQLYQGVRKRRSLPSSAEDLREALNVAPWYYTVETSPGVFTPGTCRNINMLLTRTLLSGVDLVGRSCLDLGTQEGLVPHLCCRRGARTVVAYDKHCKELQVRFLQRQLKTDFTYLSGLPLTRLPESLRSSELTRLFDVVVCSGLLYHMFNPFSGLAVARSLLRNGGLMIVETLATPGASPSLELNAEARFSHSATWLPSLAVLDHLFRLLRLQALDVVFGPSSGEPSKLRVAVLCRAVPDPLPGAGERWTSRMSDNNLEEFLDWTDVQSSLDPVSYRPRRTSFDHYPGTEAVDLVQAHKGSKPLQVTDPPSQLWLGLGATF